jgi:SAM-dependent methyltransferase
MSYFNQKGFETYGFEFSESAVEKSKFAFPNVSKNIKVGDFTKKIDYFDGLKFDFIFSNQVLYYADRKCLQVAIEQINEILNPNGLVFFTMLGTKNYYYSNSIPLPNSDLRRITLTGRLNEVTDAIFIKDEKELVDTFNLFDPLFVGHYDVSMREGSGFHFQYLGKKKKVTI